jgi:hypothetical protein
MSSGGVKGVGAASGNDGDKGDDGVSGGGVRDSSYRLQETFHRG